MPPEFPSQDENIHHVLLRTLELGDQFFVPEETKGETFKVIEKTPTHIVCASAQRQRAYLSRLLEVQKTN